MHDSHPPTAIGAAAPRNQRATGLCFGPSTHLDHLNLGFTSWLLETSHQEGIKELFPRSYREHALPRERRVNCARVLPPIIDVVASTLSRVVFQ
eukprot:scaffold161752_cov32-Tisochrysis_lutea.AAC.1